MNFVLLYKKRYFAWKKKKLIYKLVFIKTKLLSPLKKNWKNEKTNQILRGSTPANTCYIFLITAIQTDEARYRKANTVLYHLYMHSEKRNQTHLETADWWLTQVDVGVGKMSKGDQKIQTSSYKINMSWECNRYHGDYSWQFSSVYLKVSKGINLKIIFFVMRTF